MHLDSLVPSHR